MVKRNSGSVTEGRPAFPPGNRLLPPPPARLGVDLVCGPSQIPSRSALHFRRGPLVLLAEVIGTRVEHCLDVPLSLCSLELKGLQFGVGFALHLLRSGFASVSLLRSLAVKRSIFAWSFALRSAWLLACSASRAAISARNCWLADRRPGPTRRFANLAYASNDRIVVSFWHCFS